MAFAVYHAPLNFSRGTAQDNALDSRGLRLQVTAQDTGATSANNVIIRRPPLVLVHGLWSDPSAWDNFSPLINEKKADKRFLVTKAAYDGTVTGITASVPVYSNGVLAKVKANALGFANNAPTVLKAIQDAIKTFKAQFNVAATRADVVAHSMGGDIARTIAAPADFASSDTFNMGSINKLITIGTPHLGTPIAAQLLQPASQCLRDFLANHKSIALQTVTIAGKDVHGGVGDLQENSDAIGSFQVGTVLSTAYIAGVVNATNLNGLDCSSKIPALYCHPQYIRESACPNDPLAQDLRSTSWPNIFKHQANDVVPNDAIVPVASQLNNSSGLQFPGLIHSTGLEPLGFNGPAEADSSAIANKVIDLLNEKVKGGSDFHY
jgi:pimeloyl-ACP methyl ester carboxylesterase